MVVKQFKEHVEGVGDIIWDIQDNMIGFVKPLPRKSHNARFIVGLIVIAGIIYLVHYRWMWI